MKTKYGDIPHVIPDNVKKRNVFLKKYLKLCKKYGIIIDSCGYDGEIGTGEVLKSFDFDSYIESIER